MTDESLEMREGIARRDLRKGLRLASLALSEDTIRGIVDDFFS